ncbi:PTS sugar transporter subunit IIA [Candidatus Enterococcus ferrettii]|uniref:PTS system, sugar-specific IIA component n=1 Tax=Candidatus Enterococcus ferrettii TaxID=2815324 RepID=A0ABV0EMB9_9ENTE|nr:PTS glucose transporter subunit IIA [Enterococcus sp. 665A]MBO1339769.1 PTS glucose transporter subunit IIA [Enterococcus sp. 665A]
MLGFLKKKKNELYAPADGELLNLEKVNDPVFSTGMMGPGYAVEPTAVEIYGPAESKVTSVFPTKHAIGLKTQAGVEILIHLGIDTVELEGQGFDILVKEGDSVDGTTKLAHMDIDFLKEKGKPATIMVLLPSQIDRQLSVVEKTVEHGEAVGEVI